MKRRDAIRTGIFGAAGLSAYFSAASNAAANPLAPQPTHFPARAKRVIQIFLPGGVSHIDTFDPKAELTACDGKTFDKGKVLAASQWGHAAGGQSGLEVSDLFPRLRDQADELCLIRSMYGDKADHFEATLSIHSGAMVGALPGIGAWVSYGMGTENPNLPSHVVFCDKLPYAGSQSWDSNFLPTYHQGTRIRPGDEPIPDLNPSDGTGHQRQAKELELLKRLNQHHADARPDDSRLAARMHAFDAAVGLQRTAPEVFSVADEDTATLDRYGIKSGDTSSFAWQCLMARRMSERGVRFVELVDRNNWDAHSKMKSYEGLAKNVDQAIAALIADLKQRGLLDETLIVCCTEFGRTPYRKPEETDGRGHYKNAFTCWLAGGGVRGGSAYGATDEYGIEIVDQPAHIHDFHATILHLLGFDHERLTYFYNGRDFRLTGLAGNVLHDVVA
ncbi:DUF1501 domain-containing protein [Stieleria varia]|uniref:Sulfatase n=1 Tax=Stieleria varia TaxID=2528005 RepID=A0A5C6B969_9BACT|nr:DUF1501 domain-containing protein [Stieleria varia]TWU08508.1 Sulfatase [Stieleria varia]